MDIFRIFFHAFPATWDSGMNKEKKTTQFRNQRFRAVVVDLIDPLH